MASLVRCPTCDTFVKPASVSAGSCPFCPTASAASHRNPIPSLVLAAAVAALPSCTSNTPSNDPVSPPPITDPSAVYDAASAEEPVAPVDPQPAIYGGAPSDPEPEPGDPSASAPEPGQDVDVYGIAPE